MHLQLIESQFNNSHSEPIGRTPNQVIYSFNVRTALDLSLTGDGEIGTSAETALNYAKQREVHRKEPTDDIRVSQKAMIRAHAKRHQKPDWSSNFVYINLNRHGFKLPSMVKAKLSQQRVGPFEILEKVGRGNAFKLKLRPTFRIHDVISIAHLEPPPKPGSDPFERAASWYRGRDN